jgi:hypothetical protein
MLRRSSGLLGLALLLAPAAAAHAQYPSTWCERSKLDYRRNVCWPYPFVLPDRAAVAIPFGVMVERGWELQNLISDHYFEAGETRLNRAGLMKVRWVLTQPPCRYRIVFVQRGLTPEMTAARMEAVQSIALQYAPMADLASVVVESNMVDDGTPADPVVHTMTAFEKTAPDPRLPAAQTNASSANPM